MEWLFTRLVENGSIVFSIAAIVLVASCGVLFARRRWIGAVACALLACLSGAGFAVARKLTGTVARRAEQFSFRLVSDESPRTLADYHGRVVVLNFWATWCPGCVAEMPDLEKLAQQYGSSGVTVVTVSDEAPEKLRKQASGARVSAFIDGDIEPTGALENMACKGRPSTVVIDRDGRVRDVLIGQHAYASFESAVRRAL